MVCIPHQILQVDQIKKNEINSACGTYGGKKKCMQNFGKRPERNKHLEDSDVDGGY